METSTINTTNYDLVEQFMAHLLTLNSTEFTQFFCETCYERLDTPLFCRPTSPFHENTGTCSYCQRWDDVSSPHVNRFLAEHGLYLKNSSFLVPVSRSEESETADLILNWLMPSDYASIRSDDIFHNEDAQFSWVKYGRKLEKKVYRCSYLSETSKALLIAFYTHRYRADRFIPNPTEDKPQDSGIALKEEFADKPMLARLVQDGHSIDESFQFLNFTRFKAFVANTLNRWKGERI